MNFILMSVAFLVILGTALFFQPILKTNIGEGMLISVATVVLCLFLGGLAGSFTYGMYAIGIVSAAGYLVTVYNVVTRGVQVLSFLKTPYFVALVLFFVYCLIAYYNDFIQHIDEFHQWAYAVKYMLETNLLPHHSALVGNQNPYATGLFYLFFQRITGYNEQNMYVASSLLVWIGFMLPFSGYERKEWKNVILYCLIMYFGIYSLYSYGIKNLYVDLPVISWAGGLAGWWMNRTHKKVNGLILFCGAALIWYFKWKAGPLLAVFLLVFVAAHTLLIEKDALADKKRCYLVLRLIILAAVISISGVAMAGVYILKNPNKAELISRIFGAPVTREKIARTIGTFLTVIMGKPMSSKSNLHVAFIPFMVVIVLLQKVVAGVRQQKKEFCIYAVYTITMGSLFLAILLYTYLFIFSYEESTKMAGGIRYLSLYAAYIFIISLVWMFQRSKRDVSKWQERIAVGIILIFLSGVNMAFVPNMTGLNSYKVEGFKQISKSKKQIKKIEALLTEQDRVFMLDQEGEEEYAKNAAFYYLGEQVNNYNAEPWKFTEKGSIIRRAESETLSVADLPQLLEKGNYTYVWVYRTDEYLTEELPKVISCKEGIESGRLYQIIYKNEEAVGLEQIW